VDGGDFRLCVFSTKVRASTLHPLLFYFARNKPGLHFYVFRTKHAVRQYQVPTGHEQPILSHSEYACSLALPCIIRQHTESGRKIFLLD